MPNAASGVSTSSADETVLAVEGAHTGMEWSCARTRSAALGADDELAARARDPGENEAVRK